MTGPVPDAGTDPAGESEQRWFGIGAAGAPLVAHRLPDEAVGPDDGLTEPRLRDRVIRSVCGCERRRSWCPVELFVAPEAFSRCQECESVVAAAQAYQAGAGQ